MLRQDKRYSTYLDIEQKSLVYISILTVINYLLLPLITLQRSGMSAQDSACSHWKVTQESFPVDNSTLLVTIA